jgi:Tfp pilus assembly protein PilP
MQIEQKIVCPEIEKATGPICAADAPMCDPGLYCLPVTGDGGKTHCEACPERDAIRHDFKDRDFVADQTRDPFQSFVIVPQELTEKSESKPKGPCTRKEQFVATNYSYMDLRLVGIVSQGTQRKVLMIDRGNLGHIVRRGDCVGKEKAVVKDIGTGYVTFVVEPENDGRTPAQPPQEHSVQLHPKQLDVTSQPDVDVPTSNAPIVAPPGAKSMPAPPAGTAPAPTAPAPTAPTPPPAPPATK